MPIAISTAVAGAAASTLVFGSAAALGAQPERVTALNVTAAPFTSTRTDSVAPCVAWAATVDPAPNGIATPSSVTLVVVTAPTVAQTST